jgi:hypothetical protein
MLEFTTIQAPPSKEMELKCLERFEYNLSGKRNPKRFNDTHKKFQLALNVYLSTTCCSTITMMCYMIGNVSYSPGSLIVILSATIHALTVGRIIIPVSAN